MSMKTTALRTMLAPIAWGTTYVTVTELLPAGRPLFVAAVRVAPAGLLLLGIGRLGSRWRPHGAEWGRTAALAVCNFGLFLPLLIGAVYRLPGGVAAAAGGVQPLLVTAFSWVVVRRSPRRHELLTGVIAAVGVGLVVIRPGAGLDPVGVAFAMGANVSFAMGVVLTKRYPPPPNRIAATGWQLTMAGALLLPVALVAEGPPPGLAAGNLIGFAYLSLVATGVAYLLWFDGIRKLPAPAPPLLGLAAPITGAFMGWLVLDQSLSPVQLLGFAVTLAAIARGATLPDAERPVRSAPWPERAASRTSAMQTGGAAGSATSPSIPTCR
ncbi:MAG: Permease of the drug/metabolite transporter superfamily [Ilumatobacteraceae bacterium]|nr:Permease of the drug/metabolite transporter superfamily [Ilumatobacteraceae bacterium]